jgi:hypothetical protein
MSRKLNKASDRAFERDFRHVFDQGILSLARMAFAGLIHKWRDGGCRSWRGWTVTRAAIPFPRPVRALRGDGKRDARRVGKQIMNPIQENFVGVGHPLALMRKLEPGLDRECLDKPPTSATSS